jgi:DNA-binding response OmpR family regulator
MRDRPYVLVVEDENRTADWIRLYLERAGMTVATVADGPAALDAVVQQQPDLVVLDVMLPGLDGFAVCRALRADGDVPVILVTARESESDRLRGFELGADDYVVKPFSPRELVARVNALLRRARRRDTADDVLAVGPLTLDTHGLEARAGKDVVRVTRIEAELLAVLMAAPGRVFTRDQLVSRVFGDEYDG